jgi:hypothetical protein
MFKTYELESEIGSFRVNVGHRVRMHCHDGERIWASKGRTIRVFDVASAAKYTQSTISNLSPILRFEYLNRLMRSGIHNILSVNENTNLMVTKGKCLVIRNGAAVDQFAFPRGNRPLRQGIAVLNDRIYFGDYWPNSHRLPSNVYCYDLHTGILEILVTLEAARHIHFVQKSEFDEDSILIGTGDENPAVGIYSCNVLSAKLTRIGGDSQVWRAVSVIQRPPYLYWGMDSLGSKREIVRFNIESCDLSMVGTLDGPAYYSATDSVGNLFIGTTIEVRGTHRCCLYCSRDGTHWHRLAEWEKDHMHTKLFGYGFIEFINGQQNSSELFINLIGLRGQPIV